MGLGAILCPDRIGQPAPPSFHPENRLTGFMVIAHFNHHAEHNWFPTCCIADFQSAEPSPVPRFWRPRSVCGLETVGNPRYSRFGNLRYGAVATLNNYASPGARQK